MRALALLGITAWAACSAPDLLPDEAPPPAGFGRVPYLQVAGQPLRFRFELPVARARLRVYASLTEARACSPAVTGVCVRLADPQLLAEVPVDPSGTTQVEVAWPAWLDGRAGVHVQAALALAPGRAAASQVWDDRIVDADDDSDHDGLSAAQEHALSLRLDRADTDGGGSLDGQEVADGTRPDLAGDDLRTESLCHNGLDDDADGLPDCEDGDCGAGCVETDCGDQVDDDFDGTIDCADDDCWTTDCVDHTLAWTTHGETRTSSYQENGGFFHSWMGAAAGKVVLFKGAYRRTCEWRGSVWMSNVNGHQSVFELGPRLRVDGDCDVGSEVVPPAQTGLWGAGGWYGVQRHRTLSWQWDTCAPIHRNFRGYGGPLLPAVAYGTCPGGVTPILAWPDLDGDGYGVSEATDLHGAQVDRSFFCGAVPTGFSRVGGDCDDLDASWSPPLVVVDEGIACADLSPNDRDGDGVSPPTDPDDRDNRTWGQELICADGSDNDQDGLSDCEDGDCVDRAGCDERSCQDQSDNDADGLIDCADTDCWGPDCNTSRVAWLMRASLTGTWEERPEEFRVYVSADDLIGRVRTAGPQGTNTCTWTADHARGWSIAYFASEIASCYQHEFRTGAGVVRDNFEVTPGCFVDENAIGATLRAQDGARPALGWYGPMDVVGTQDTGAVRLLAAGPNLDGAPSGCRATRFYPDLDHDGFGVSDPTDLHGALGGLRYACGAVPADGVTTGGDCDDQDATWSPALITRAPGAPCEAVRPDDRDGDGALVGVDADDLDGRVQ